VSVKAFCAIVLLFLVGCAGTPSVEPLPEDLLRTIERRLLELPYGQEKSTLTEAEVERLYQLRAARRGTPDDREFLEKRVLADALPRMEAEARRAPPKKEEPKAAEGERRPEGPTDTVIMRDGRKLHGYVTQRAEGTVTVRFRFGSVRLPEADVDRVEPGTGPPLDPP
jgi:hypothetical protein